MAFSEYMNFISSVLIVSSTDQTTNPQSTNPEYVTKVLKVEQDKKKLKTCICELKISIEMRIKICKCLVKKNLLKARKASKVSKEE